MLSQLNAVNVTLLINQGHIMALVVLQYDVQPYYAKKPTNLPGMTRHQHYVHVKSMVWSTAPRSVYAAYHWRPDN
jgi:hypothetical protein